LRSAECPTGPVDPAPGGMVLSNGAMPPLLNNNHIDGGPTLRPLPPTGAGATYHAPGEPAPQPAPALTVPTVPGAALGTNTPAFPGTPGSPFNYRFPPAHPQREPFFHLREVPGWPRQNRIPGWPRQQRLAQRSMISPEGTRIAIGQDEPKSTSTWVAYGVAGLVAGAALRMFLGARKAKA